MGNKGTLSHQTVRENLQKVQAFMAQQKLDAFYVSSFDVFLNEYVPLTDNLRYFFSAFTGSMAEMIIPRQGKARLYVDGRYHEQADQEVPLEIVEVVKCTPTDPVQTRLLEDVAALKGKLGVVAERTALGLFKRMAKLTTLEAFTEGEVDQLVGIKAAEAPPTVELVERELRGRDTLEKTALCCPTDQHGLFLTALDQIAWVTNCRGYHLPFLSSFKARALVTRKKVYVFVSPETPIQEKAQKTAGIEWLKLETRALGRELARLQNTLLLDHVAFDPAQLNCADFTTLLNVFHPERLKEVSGGLVEHMSIKEPAEIRAMEKSFEKSDRAIVKTIRWVKENIAAGKRLTELDLFHQTRVFYDAEGARELSFNTIAGVGPNASIIHYGSPSDQVTIKDDDMILLDSGGYFAAGFATDTTRTFFASPKGEANPQHKKIYTLVLKGLLQCQSAVFPEGTKGNVLDGICRGPLLREGFNYAHGTGHGVGIHVHEDGVRLSLISNVPMKAGQVVSIEPGIYLPGQAGVRLENIAVVEKHPQHAGMLCFRPLTQIGFDPNLIDAGLLNSDEVKWLRDYEAICEKRGTSLKA